MKSRVLPRVESCSIRNQLTLLLKRGEKSNTLVAGQRRRWVVERQWRGRMESRVPARADLSLKLRPFMATHP